MIYIVIQNEILSKNTKNAIIIREAIFVITNIK